MEYITEKTGNCCGEDHLQTWLAVGDQQWNDFWLLSAWQLRSGRTMWTLTCSVAGPPWTDTSLALVNMKPAAARLEAVWRNYWSPLTLNQSCSEHRNQSCKWTPADRCDQRHPEKDIRAESEKCWLGVWRAIDTYQRESECKNSRIN